MGCVLDDRHLLTARHCWEEISYHYRWPVTLRHNGMFRCEVVFEDARRDIAVLRTIEKISGNDMEPITRYPNLSNEELFLGAPVGFVTSLTLHDSADEATSQRHPAIRTFHCCDPVGFCWQRRFSSQRRYHRCRCPHRGLACRVQGLPSTIL
jgi:hypothetical protein